MVEELSDDDIWKLKRGGHDYRKVYAAYKAAMEHTGQPTVILAQTIKGYGLGPHFAGRNATHQMKKLTLDDLQGCCATACGSRSATRSSRRDPYQPPYYHPGDDDETIKYLLDRRRQARRPRSRAPGRQHRAQAAGGLGLRRGQARVRQAAGRHHDGVRPAAART